MQRANRLLTIYTRLLMNQSINKYELSNEFNVNERTVQRDIDNIRSYLSDSTEFLYRREIRYDHLRNFYTLSSNDSRQSSDGLHLLMIRLYDESPIIDSQIYQVLRHIIMTTFSHDAAALTKRLEQFNVTEQQSLYEKISVLERHIDENTLLYVQTDDREFHILPFSITYRHKHYYLTGYEDHQEQSIPILQIIDMRPSSSIVEMPDELKVTLEMTKELWHELKDIYSVDVIESISPQTIIVTFIMTMTETIELCMIHSPHVRLLNHQDHPYLVDHLLRLNAVYLNQKIQSDDE